MKTNILLLAVAFLAFGCKDQKKTGELSALEPVEKTQEMKSLHEFKVIDLYGEPFDFASLKGKKVLVVNTASECGLTPQYKGLQELYETFKDRDFVIVGFPANNFGGQEPGSDEEIAEFCEANYGVSFPMMSKISVKGEDMHPVYRFLTSKEQNGYMDTEVSWNFQKYLVDADGHVVAMKSPQTLPADESIINWITGENE
ncbi:glutathione peroxidase [Robertkochia aurantiaca]|uniref:glutathione peroxidase n=1 Tax=Robertkochia aurantiaca TaxID=2873700 RepID=UPI001CCBD45A|nr:glutathione peroxidase [Robertkochia sp. 3YJGBD-33]